MQIYRSSILRDPPVSELLLRPTSEALRQVLGAGARGLRHPAEGGGGGARAVRGGAGAAARRAGALRGRGQPKPRNRRLAGIIEGGAQPFPLLFRFCRQPAVVLIGCFLLLLTWDDGNLKAGETR